MPVPTVLIVAAIETLRSAHEVATELIDVISPLYALVSHSPLMTLGLMLLLAAVVLFLIRGMISIAMYVALLGSMGLLLVGIANALL